MKTPEEIRDEEYDYGMTYEDCEDDNEVDEFEEAMDNCSQLSDGFCMQAGSEYCEFECPFNEEMYRNMQRKNKSK